MSREIIMAEGTNSPDIEPQVMDLTPQIPKPFEKQHIPGMGHLGETQQFLAEGISGMVKKHAPEQAGQIDPSQIAQEMLNPKITEEPGIFTPEHPFGTLGALPRTDIKPNQVVNMVDVDPEELARQLAQAQSELGELRKKVGQESASREVAEQQVGGLRQELEQQKVARESVENQVRQEAEQKLEDITRQRDITNAEKEDLSEQLLELQVERRREIRQLERDLRQEYEERENGLIDQHDKELRQEKQQRQTVEREAQKAVDDLNHNLDQERDRADKLDKSLSEEKDLRENVERERDNFRNQLKKEGSDRGADAGRTSGPERFAQFGQFNASQTIEQIRVEAETLVVKELANVGNVLTSDESLLKLFLEHRRNFENLIGAKRGMGEDVREIETIEQVFTIKWVLGTTAAAAENGFSSKWEQIVTAPLFRDVIGSVLGSRGDREHSTVEGAIKGVREGAQWVIGNQGQAFRDPIMVDGKPKKPNEKVIIERIASNLRELNPEEAHLAATLTYQLYISSGEIIKVIGPVMENGQVLDQYLDSASFIRRDENQKPELDQNGQAVIKRDRTNPEYWSRRFMFWKKHGEKVPELSGEYPYMWFKTAFVRNWLDTLAFKAKGLINPLGELYVMPATTFYGTSDLLDLSDRINGGIVPHFFAWAAVVKGADDASGKLAGYFNTIFADPAKGLDDPSKIGETMKLYLNLCKSFGYTVRYRPNFRYEVRGRILMESIKYLNSPEGQKTLNARKPFEGGIADLARAAGRVVGEVLNAYRRWGPLQIFSVIEIAKIQPLDDEGDTALDEDNANQLKKYFHVTRLDAMAVQKARELGEEAKKFIGEDVSKGLRS